MGAVPPLPQRILDCLRNQGPQKSKSIYIALGLDPEDKKRRHAFNVTLSSMTHAGRVMTEGPRTARIYSLPPEGTS